MNREEVILVDEFDKEIGVMEKLEAHQKGLLHRAISVFVFNDQGEMLLQQRALSKYHSPGLWTNTCCSHPRPDENVSDAAVRRLKEEMGLNCSLNKKFEFLYKAEFDNGLIEHEYDHVFVGISNTQPVINKSEVEEYQWIHPDLVNRMIVEYPENFTPWFKILLTNHSTELIENNL